MFAGPFDLSILKKAQEKGLLKLQIKNIRDFGLGKHKLVDDKPYGGGTGMVMRVDVLHKAVIAVREQLPNDKQKIFLLSARGKTFNQIIAKEFASLEHLILICGHYEGVDERISTFIDGEISIGDFIATGGEIPAMLIVDAVTRLIPGVLKEGVTEHESFSLSENNDTLLEYPHYTNPREYEGQIVPDVLLSGNHEEIDKWRIIQAKQTTKQQRPDLVGKSKVVEEKPRSD